MKKVLMVATVPSMIGQFNMRNVQMLKSMGYEVHVACDFLNTSVWNEEKISQFKKQLSESEIIYHQLSFPRNPLMINKVIKSAKELNRLLKRVEFDFIHCHTPVASVVSRIIAHFQKIKVIYTAHGFHFFKGAPLMNWLVYYPIEKILSKWTDILITINEEDYNRAEKKFYARKTFYIPGVGIDVSRIKNYYTNETERLVKIDELRKNLSIKEEEFVLISVGELNDNKNHEMVIKAIAQLSDLNIKYLVCGAGEKETDLKQLIIECGLEGKVSLVGYKTNVVDFLNIADAFVFPSKREGLGLAALEAMAVGLPLLTSNVHGINDYSKDGITGYSFNPLKENEVVKAIRRLCMNEDLRKECTVRNPERVEKYDKCKTDEIMQQVYKEISLMP